MKTNLLLSLALIIYVNTNAQFGAQQIITTSTDGATKVYAADIDGDGDMDVLSASQNDNKIAWYENTDGLGSFSSQKIISTNTASAISVYAADIDGDGDLDVLSASQSDDKIAWYENTDGKGSFGSQQIITTNTDGAYSVYASDIDGDGDMDVLSASYKDDKVAWYENTDGKGSFGSQQIITTTTYGANFVYTGDLDGDGDMDVLSGSSYDDKVAWYENTDGKGTFGSPQIITTDADKVRAVYPFDLDGDGDLDVLSASWADDKIAWYENTDGKGSFGGQQIITLYTAGARSVYAADMDRDGDLDVVTAAMHNNQIAWFENTDGKGTFGEQQIISTDTDQPQSVYPVDINGNGDMDVLSASFADDKIAWYENTGSLNTYVPDDNFEQALIDLGYDTAPLNDSVPTANISTVVSLNVSDKSISDLTGIEDFTALKGLWCNTNHLTNLDITNNSNLEWFECANNQLTSLDVTKNTALASLFCHSNQLTDLNVSINTLLKQLSCSDNLLSSIDLSKNTLLTHMGCTKNLLTSLDITKNTLLINMACVQNQLTSLDVTLNTSLEDLNCQFNQITSLDISKNTKLKRLWCGNNQLSGLDVGLNAALTYLDCKNNQLTVLDAKNGNNTNFTEFNATNNPILSCIVVDDASWSTTNWTKVDAYANFVNNATECTVFTAMTYVPDDNFEQALIDLGYDTAPLNDSVPTANINTVVSLNVSDKSIADLTGIEDFVELINLWCNNNQLTNLNLIKNIALTDLFCHSNQLTGLDVTKNTELKQLSCSDNPLTSIDLSKNTLLTHLGCSQNQLTSLDLSKNTLLINLSCVQNQLTNLDLSKNTLLKDLNCQFNKITSLNISKNTSLERLWCGNNQLSGLDVGINASLTYLDCKNNQLTGLGVKNGNNTNFTEFNATNNPNLSCIIVDDASWSTTNWTNIDNTSTFVNNASECTVLNAKTYVPDDNFEQALIDLGYDTAPLDDSVLTANINTITSLNISEKNITDLRGIEDFAELKGLWCNNNQLTSIDLTMNIALIDLFCHSNQLTGLDVTKNTELKQLSCSDNPLSGIDLSNNTLLTHLGCSQNQLTSLDLSKNTLLINMACVQNQLTNLDVSKNTLLEDMNCQFNQLTSLDISKNTSLERLWCGNNQLSGLDVGVNTNLTYLDCKNNQLTGLDVKNGNNTNFTEFNTTNNADLTCIEVDNASWSTTNWTNIDNTSTFVNNATECVALGTETFGQPEVKIYPNPTKGNVTFERGDLENIKISIYNITGNKVYSVDNVTEAKVVIPTDNLRQGVYFVKINSNKQQRIIKLVKQ